MASQPITAEKQWVERQLQVLAAELGGPLERWEWARPEPHVPPGPLGELHPAGATVHALKVTVSGQEQVVELSDMELAACLGDEEMQREVDRRLRGLFRHLAPSGGRTGL